MTMRPFTIIQNTPRSPAFSAPTQADGDVRMRKRRRPSTRCKEGLERAEASVSFGGSRAGSRGRLVRSRHHGVVEEVDDALIAPQGRVSIFGARAPVEWSSSNRKKLSHLHFHDRSTPVFRKEKANH